MILIQNTEVHGWEAAVRGMRNPMNSWEMSDSEFPMAYQRQDEPVSIGPADLDLMRRLANAGPDHGKCLRYIDVTADITAPLYWWKEFDTYKVGTVANSCSTMHKIHAKEFTLGDFSLEQLLHMGNNDAMDAAFINGVRWDALDVMELTVKVLNYYRERYIRTAEKCYWWQLIQLLPSSYNQRRTVHLNYAVLRAMHKQRKGHPLDEWRTFCRWAESLPYAAELIVEGEAGA